MQFNFFYLAGVGAGALLAWLIDYGLHHSPGEGIVWDKVKSSVVGAVSAAAAGTLAVNMQPVVAELNGGLMLAYGILAGALGHWGGSTTSRGTA